MTFHQDIRTQTAPSIQPSIVIQKDQAFSGVGTVGGDLTGDGKIEFVTARNDEQAITAISAYNLSGEKIWDWGEANAGSPFLSYDLPMQAYDINQDGKCEVIFSSKGFIHCLEGSTGKELWKYALPLELPVADCIWFAKLTNKDYATDIIIKSRYRKIWAITSAGQPLWEWAPKWGIKTCHAPTPVDLDGDGFEEIFAGHQMLDNTGKPIWRIRSRHARGRGHLDCVRIVKKGKSMEDFQFIFTYCGSKYIALIDGKGKVLWDHQGHHFESIDQGIFLRDQPSPQFYVDIDHRPFGEAEGHFYDINGRLIGVVNMSYGRQHRAVDWTGDGLDEIVITNPMIIMNGHGKLINILECRDGEEIMTFPQNELRRTPHMGVWDVTGKGSGDVVIFTEKTINIFNNPHGKSAPARQRWDSGNFTFY